MGRRFRVAALCALAATACTRESADALPESLRRLGNCFLAQPVRSGGDWLLCGRFELTLAEYRPEDLHLDGELPARGLTLEECRTWCAERGLRLPDAEEWRVLATGGAGPAWTPGPAGNRNDLELGLGRPLPVGVFERGRSPQGGYDFFGNVWERLAREPGAVSPAGSTASRAAGGSYASRAVGAEDWLQLGAGDRLEDVGMRYVADASSYVMDYAVPAWESLSRRERARCAELYARWLPELRRSFADRLEQRGAPQAFCQQVRGR